jgi:phosphohistidine phosphatase SixA
MRLLLILILLLGSGPARADAAFWAAAREEGTHLLMRHARAPGVGDPAGFRRDDCATQRNLDDAGRDQARRIGAAIREAGLTVDLVLTSVWCRAADTAALLALGPVGIEPSLASFFGEPGEAERATGRLKGRLAELGDTKAVLVTHQVNITALTGVYPASGELVAVRIDPASGDVEVRGRLAIP